MEEETGYEESDVFWRDKAVRDRLGFALIHDTKYTDIVFVVGKNEETISAHKLILRLSSLTFDDIISNHENQGMNVIKLPNIVPSMFKRLLKFIYTDELEMHDFQSFIRIAEDFGFRRLAEQTQKVLMKTDVTFENAVLILDIAIEFDDSVLEQRVLDFIRRNATDVLESKSFVQISHPGLCKLLLDDELCADEFCVFKAVIKWATFRCKKKDIPVSGKNSREVLKDARFYVRYKLLTYGHLICEVKNSEILTASEFLVILKSYVDPSDNPLGISSSKRELKLDFKKALMELAPNNNVVQKAHEVPTLNSVKQALLQEMLQYSIHTPAPAVVNSNSDTFQLHNCSMGFRDLLNAVQLQFFLVQKIVLSNVKIHSALATEGRRVYLPNLESFHFLQEKDLSAKLPDTFFMDGLTTKEFLFFEKHKKKLWDFKNLFFLGVEIRICVKGIKLMELDPRKEKLTLAFPNKKEVDAILQNLTLPHCLKSLCLASCNIIGADNLSTRALETLVIQGVTFQGNGDSKVKTLVNKCSRLKSLSIFVPSGLKVNFATDFKSKLKATLEKLALTKTEIKAKGRTTNIEPFLCLTELYLDACTWPKGFPDSFINLFPKLKSLAIRSIGACRPNRLLKKALDIPSLERVAIFRSPPGADTSASVTPNLNVFVPPVTSSKVEMIKFLTTSGLKFTNEEVPDFILIKDLNTGVWQAIVDLAQLDEIHFYHSMLNEFFIDSYVSKLTVL